MSKKKKKAKITKGERFLYVTATFCLAFTLVLKVFCGAGVSHLSMSIEKMNYDINSQIKKNESLTMKENELT